MPSTSSIFTIAILPRVWAPADQRRGPDPMIRLASPATTTHPTEPDRMDQAFKDAITAGYTLTEPGLVLGSAMHDGELFNDTRVQVALSMLNRHGLIAGATGTGKTKTLQLMAGQLSKAGRAGLRRGHQGRPDRPGGARRRDEPEAPRAHGVDGLDLRGGRPPGRVPVAVRASSAPRSGRRSTRSARCCSARSSTSTRRRRASSPSSSSTATTTTCRCSTWRTCRRRSSTSRRTRASRSSPTTAGCRRRRSASCCARSSSSSRKARTSSSASRSSRSPTCCGRRPRAPGSSASSSCPTSWTSRGCSRRSCSGCSRSCTRACRRPATCPSRSCASSSTRRTSSSTTPRARSWTRSSGRPGSSGPRASGSTS